MSDFLMKNTHLLGIENFYQTEYRKKQIIIGNTFASDLNHITRWQTRMNGKCKNTAPITILKDGTIHIHFDPKHHSDFMDVKDIDMYAIPIVLENQGWLTKDLQNDRYLTWVGDIYNEENGVVETRWRNHTYWTPYTDEQVDSLVKVCKYLCERFDIPLETLSHNTYVNLVEDFEGITYKGNFSKYYSDVSPAFKFDEFKNKLELK